MRTILSAVVWWVMCGIACAAEPHGTILDAEGLAVPGAIILVQDADDRLLTQTRSDEAGHFSVPELELSDRPLQMVVFKEGLALGGGPLGADNVIHLTSESMLQGRVVDGRGQPVSGVIVQCVGFVRQMLPGGEGSMLSLRQTLLEEFFSATTNASGQWSIRGAPATGRAVLALNDDRFLHRPQMVRIGSEATLTARAAASVSGRATDASGAPLAEVRMEAWGQGQKQGEALTRDDGSYRLGGLAPGRYMLVARDPSGERVGRARRVVAEADPGDPSEAFDLVLESGIAVQGRVVDAETAQPVAGAVVASHGPHAPMGEVAPIAVTTDEAGAFALRVAEGSVMVFIAVPPRGYLHNTQQVQLEARGSQAPRVRLTLQRAIDLAGVVRDEGGKPVANVPLDVLVHDEDASVDRGGRLTLSTAVAGPDGQFTVIGLRAGVATISAGNGWQIVAPKQIRLPAEGSIQVQVQQVPRRALQGRVVDGVGAAVEDATVHLQILSADADPDRPAGRQVQTSGAGLYTIEDVAVNALVQLRAEKQGHWPLGGGEVRSTSEGFKVSDLILAPLHGTVEGVVVREGEPVAGAIVMALDSVPEAQATTDATGYFRIEKLPAGDVRVLALSETSMAEIGVGTDTSPVTLFLSAATAPAEVDRLARAMLESVWNDPAASTEQRRFVPAYLAPYDLQTALQWARSTSGPERDRILAAIAAAVADDAVKSSSLFEQLGLEEIREPSSFVYAAAHLGLAAASAGDQEQAADWYRQATAQLPHAPDGLLEPQAICAALSARLGGKNAYGRSAQVMQEARVQAQGPEHIIDQRLAGLVLLLSDGGTEPIDAGLGGVSASARPAVRARVIAHLAEKDTAVARQLLEDFVPDAPGDLYHYGAAAIALVPAIGPDDPAEAMRIAMRVRHPLHKPLAMAMAARWQNPPKRGDLYRRAMKQITSLTGTAIVAAHIAALATADDAVLGRELADQALAHRKRGDPAAVLSSQPLAPGFAYYCAAWDPAEARRMLEEEIVSLALGEHARHATERLFQVTCAMARLDVDRTMELLDRLEQISRPAAQQARLRVARRLLTSDGGRWPESFDQMLLGL